MRIHDTPFLWKCRRLHDFEILQSFGGCPFSGIRLSAILMSDPEKPVRFGRVSERPIAQPAVLGGRWDAAGDGGASGHMRIHDTPFPVFQQAHPPQADCTPDENPVTFGQYSVNHGSPS